MKLVGVLVVLVAAYAASRWLWEQRNGAKMQAETTAHLKRIEDVIQEAKALLGLHGYPDDLRTVVVIGFMDQMREHHDAMLLLIRSGLVGSAFALSRAIFECLYRGLWINGCASDAEIQQFEEEDRLPLKMHEMGKAIDATYKAGDFYEDFRKRAWGPMCSFAHTGLLQLGRRFAQHKVEPTYSDEEIFQATTTATTCVLLLVDRFLAAQNHAPEAAAAQKLIESYGPVLARTQDKARASK
jgi:hypothetical protein